MKKKNKMNGLYKTAFILLIVSVILLGVAIFVAYALERTYFSCIFSGAGVFLAFLGIIFATVSKPKKSKNTKSDISNAQTDFDADENNG